MKNRFSEKAGEEYKLFKLSCPHFEELEGKLGEIIKENYESSSKSKIDVIEIGCGPGFTTEIILESDERVNVVAVDNEKVMINQISKFLKDYVDAGRLEIVESDALNYLKSLANESFDVFASGFTLHNFEQKYRNNFLKEVYRILKKGGLFVNADKYALDDEKEHKKMLDWQLNNFKEKYSEIGRDDLVKVWTEHYLEDEKPGVLMKEGKSILFMKEIGFEKVDVVYRNQMESVVVARK